MKQVNHKAVGYNSDFELFTGHNTNASNTTEEALKLIRKSLKSCSMDQDGTRFDGTYPHIFVTFGASVSSYLRRKHFLNQNAE